MPRSPNTTAAGYAFDAATIEAVWRKGNAISGHQNYRTDNCNALMQRDAYGSTSSKYGWEIDHIKPVAKGGTDELSNLQPLQWENNRYKSDDWPNWVCKVRN